MNAGDALSSHPGPLTTSRWIWPPHTQVLCMGSAQDMHHMHLTGSPRSPLATMMASEASTMSTMLGMLSKDSTLAITSIVCSQEGQGAQPASLMRDLQESELAACTTRPVPGGKVPELLTLSCTPGGPGPKDGTPESTETEDIFLCKWRTDQTCS